MLASAQTLAELTAQLQAALVQLQFALGQGAVLGASDDEPDGVNPIGIYCPYLTITMQRGARDATTNGQVSELQAFLTDYFDLDENIVVGGYFGRLTEKYVKQFQTEHGLPSFGIVGSLTRAKIAQVCGKGQLSTFRLTVPNGGEQWEIGMMNTITWSPYNPNAGINPAKDVTAYLEYKDKATGQLVVLGQVQPAGKASIHWNTGQINGESGNAAWAPPGQYWIRVVNNVTGRTDRSDESFAILPRSVDVKVNSSDGPLTIDPNEKVWVTWDSTGKDSCSLYGVSDVKPPYGGNQTSITNLPPNGKREVYVWFYDPSYGATVTANCMSQTGQQAGDWVQINTTTQSASLMISSPNGGERLPLEVPTNIFWSQSGISRFSIALYKNDQWKQWIVKDSSAASDGNKNSFLFNPLIISDAPGLPAMGNVFKIYITGQKTDGSGNIEDKSDAPFRFGSTVPGTFPINVSPTSGQTPLKVTLSFGLSSLCDSYTVYWGNGSSVGPSQGCSPVSVITLDNTYFLPTPYAATYIITIKNHTTGQSATQSITVLPGPAPTFNFVNPPFDWVLSPGDQATIRWNASPPSGRPMSAYKVSFAYILEGSPSGTSIDAGWVPLSANQALWNIRTDIPVGTYRLRATIIEEGPSGAPTVAEVTSNPFTISLDRYREFSVQPVGGTVPVTVTATFQLGSSCTPYSLFWGDGSNSSYAGPPPGVTCNAQVPPPSSISHTYTSVGTYLVTFQPQGQPFVSKTIDVYGPPAVSMSINGQSAVTLPAGSTFTIVWSSTNATSCSITNAQGGTGPTPPNVSGSSQGGVPAAGQTYTYRLACTNAYGTASQTATVTGQ